MRSHCIYAAALLFAASSLAAAEELRLSPDVTVELGVSSTVSFDDELADASGATIAPLGVLPEAADLTAFFEKVSGERLFSLDISAELAGAVFVRPADVVAYDGGSYSLAFDADAAGVPEGVSVDAVADYAGTLFLSFDTTVALGPTIAADEDIVSWNGSSFSLALDASALGIPAGLDLDGLQVISPSAYLLSFDGNGRVGGVDFADEDLVRLDGTAWSLERDVSTLDSGWGGSDVDAIFVPEPGFGGLLAGIVALARLGRRRASIDKRTRPCVRAF